MEPPVPLLHLLQSDCAVWQAIDPGSAHAYRHALARDPVHFSRGALSMAATWLVRCAGLDAPWVQSAGEAHHQRFATHARGRLRGDGRPVIGFGISPSDHQHPAPWHWDLILLLASVDLSLSLPAPALKRLATAVMAEYLRTLIRIADDDGEAAMRIDLNGLPEMIKRAIEKDSEPEAFDTHLARYCMGLPGRQRLRPTRQSVDERRTSDLMAGLLATALPLGPHGQGAPIEVVRQRTRDPLLMGDPGWLALVHEQDRSGAWRPRLVAIRERQSSALSRILPMTPFPPHATPVPRRSADPFSVQITSAGRAYQAGTFSHAHRSPSLARLDHGDLLRLAQLWGQLLAGCHCDGLSALGIQVNDHVDRIRTDAQHRADELPGLAHNLARTTRQAHAVWKRLCTKSVRVRRG